LPSVTSSGEIIDAGIYTLKVLFYKAQPDSVPLLPKKGEAKEKLCF